MFSECGCCVLATHVMMLYVWCLSVCSEFLYMESFLQTIKREWTGIDRLRMDKFLQVTT